MKTKNIFYSLLVAGLSFTACSENNSNDDDSSIVTEEQMDVVIANYVDKTVLPTYKDMVEKVGVLKEKVDAFVSDGTAASLNAACDAWRTAREPWERSEAFLFGPADYESLDPSLDTWPLDKDGIDQMLQTLDFDQIQGNTDEAQNLRGFHTLEYLLFDGGSNKRPENVTANEKAYMSIVARLLKSDTDKLYKAWNEGGTSECPTAFGEEFKKHNTTRFPSAATSINQIIDGCRDIVGEVGDQKIGNPYTLYTSGKKEEGVLAVESWYSWNSLTDYTDNIISIENSYMGGREDIREEENSLHALVASISPTVDTRVRNAIQAAIEAINDIPAPFRNHLDSKTEIEAAQEACAELDRALLAIKATLQID